jgi:hypothetical protein
MTIELASMFITSVSCALHAWESTALVALPCALTCVRKFKTFRPGKDGSAGGVRESRHTIDYCMYAGAGLSVSEILSMPTAEDLGEARAPSFTYPSDHFSLQVHFSLP